jgi:hypothetical protein
MVLNKLLVNQCHLEVPSGVPEKFSMPIVIWRKPYIYLAPRLTLSPNGPKWVSIRPMSPRSTIRCAWKDFHAHGTFDANSTPILRLDEHCLQTDWNDPPLDTRHHRVPMGVPQNISMPMVHSAQTIHISSFEINTMSKQTKTSFRLTHVT